MGKKNVKRKPPMKGRRKDVETNINEKFTKGPKYVNQSVGRQYRIEDASNDVSWYAQNSQLLADAASLPFSQNIGIAMPMAKLNYKAGSTNVFANQTAVVPGVMAIKYVPGVGVSNDRNSPINVASTNLYSFVRHANSGHSNYDHQDLMMYVMAMDSVYSFIAFARRIYRVARTYSIRNRYYPQAILRAHKMDPDSVQKQLAQIRFTINSLILKASSLCVPKGMPIFDRHTWMCDNLYLDAENDKAQTFVFIPEGFYVYNEVSGAGKLTWTPYKFKNASGIEVTLSTNPADDLMALGNSILNPILASEDMNIMSGDILKAYGEGGLHKLSPLEENEFVIPQYVPEVLMQIHNSTAVGGLSNCSNLDIIQNVDTGAILYQPKVSGYNSVLGQVNYWLDIRSKTPTPADVMVATRLAARVIFGAGANVTDAKPIVCGSEFITIYELWNSTKQESGSGNLSTVLSGDNNTAATIFDYLSIVTFFDWAPRIYVNFNAATTPTIYQIGDTDNVTVVDDNTISNLHIAALLSEFDLAAKY